MRVGVDEKYSNTLIVSMTYSPGIQALEHIVYYVVLAQHDNEQSDMLHRLFIDPALVKLELH